MINFTLADESKNDPLIVNAVPCSPLYVVGETLTILGGVAIEP